MAFMFMAFMSACSCQGKSEAFGRRVRGGSAHAFPDEAVSEHAPCRGLRNAPGGEEEKAVRRHLPDRGAVGAANVVGIDFEFRLGVHLGVRMQRQVAVAQ